MPGPNNVYKPKMAGFLIAAIALVMVVIVILVSTILILSAGGDGKATTAPDGVNTPLVSTSTTPEATDDPMTPTTPSVTTSPNDPNDDPNLVIPGAETLVMTRSQIGEGALVLIDTSHFYTKEGLVRHPSLTSATASTLGLGALSGNTGNYLLRQSSLYLELNAREAFSKMMADFAIASSSGEVQVRNAYYFDSSLTAVTDNNSRESVEHSTGCFVDLEINRGGKVYPLNHPSLKEEFYDWFIGNCWEYGFVHWRDTEKYSTFRYVGIAHAAALHKESSVAFETYLTALTAYKYDNRMKVTDSEGNEWWIYYVEAEDTAETIYVPVLGSPEHYQVSGDNVGGFIVAINSAQFAK